MPNKLDCAAEVDINPHVLVSAGIYSGVTHDVTIVYYRSSLSSHLLDPKNGSLCVTSVINSPQLELSLQKYRLLSMPSLQTALLIYHYASNRDLVQVLPKGHLSDLNYR